MAQKRESIDALFKQHGDDVPDAVATEIEGKLGEIDVQQKQYEQALRLEKAQEDNDAELKRLNGTASNPIPHGAGRKGGQAQFEGFTPAGETVLERRGADLSVVYEEGNLGLDQKTLEVISDINYKRAYRSFLRKGVNELSLGERKVLEAGSDEAGGYLVPDDVLSTIIERKPTPTRMAGRVNRLQTSRDALSIARLNYSADDKYTTGIRVTWTGEKPASDTAARATDPSFGQVRIPIHTAMLSLGVTNNMVEDSAYPIVSWASGKFQETIDLLYEDMILNGNGIGQPAGILMNPGGTDQPSVINTGDANLITGDGLIDLTESLPEQYDDNSVLVFNKTSTGKAIRKLKDSDGRPLVSYGAGDNGLASGRFKEVNGYPYIWSGFMPNVAANAYPIIHGDPMGYYLVNRIGFSIQVLREKYAEQNQLVLLGRVRFGGQPAESWRLKVQKVSA
jgi:HK97 family phage major capsid protein